MTASKRVFLGLDIGERRIGAAVGDAIGRIAQPIGYKEVDDGSAAIIDWCHNYGVTDIIVGRPRSQSGELSSQTIAIERYVDNNLTSLDLPIHWQDESVTSIIAEDRLRQRGKPYAKGDIDAEAATIILQDFLDGGRYE